MSNTPELKRVEMTPEAKKVTNEAIARNLFESIKKLLGAEQQTTIWKDSSGNSGKTIKFIIKDGN